MNGYICLSAGEPCPPIFRSPVSGMEDIVDSQVMCAIYKLPDYHKHVAKPPVGVRFPKKIVSMGELQESVLWHEDSGRRHMDNGRRQMDNARRHIANGRPNPPGSLSGRLLGDAAHRLVINSLQTRAGQNGHDGQVHTLSGDSIFNSRDYSKMKPPPAVEQNHHDNRDYGKMMPPSAVEQNHHKKPYSARPAPPPRHQHRTNISQNQRNNYSAPSGVAPMPVYFMPGPHQAMYPIFLAPPVGAYHHQSGYSSHHQIHQSYGVGGYNQWDGGPQSNGSAKGHGDNALQRGVSRFAVLDRGSNRRPSPSGHGRR